MTVRTFSFAHHAQTFDQHIERSIPGYRHLVEKSVGLARRFVQNDSKVVDIGCSTGLLLAAIQDECRRSRQRVSYIGLDIEPRFSSYWQELSARGLTLLTSDARSFAGYTNMSLACSMFTLQFIPPADKMPLLQRICHGLNEGGALMISEKILASSGRLQDALTFPYYDYKISRKFGSKSILDKERSLRGQMTLWTRKELENALISAGFREIEGVWESFPFVSVLALK